MVLQKSTNLNCYTFVDIEEQEKREIRYLVLGKNYNFN